MFKNYKKLNKFFGLITTFLLFGFFACNFHFNTEHKNLCSDNQTQISNNLNQQQILSLAILPTEVKIFEITLTNTLLINTSNLSSSPPDNRLYIKNSVLLI